MACVVSCSQNVPNLPIEEVQIDQLVGRVSTIYPEQNYMLIQKIRSINTESDSIYYTRNAQGQTPQIKLTGQQLGQFYVADFDEPNIKVNDPVFCRNLRKYSEDHANEQDSNTDVAHSNF